MIPLVHSVFFLTMAMNQLRRITYTSEASVPFDRRALLDLLHEARGFNHIDQITGLLLHDRGRFLQVVEGPAKEVGDLLERLQRDARHKNFKIHSDLKTEIRLFPDWKMGFGDLADPTLSFLPGMASDPEEHDRLQLMVSGLDLLAPQINLALADRS